VALNSGSSRRRPAAGFSLAALAVSLLTLATGCSSTALQVVDAQSRPPYIDAFAVNPKDGSLLLATNKGLFHIDADGKKGRPLRSEVKVSNKGSAFGDKVSAFAFVGPNRLLGSGHPDDPTVPGNLGLMQSSDGGASWKAVSRVGLSDLHVIKPQGGLVFAYDTVLGAAIVSSDSGKTFAERDAPAEPVTDLASDPQDPNYLLAASVNSLAVSTDQARSWKTLGPADQPQLAWGAHGLFRADAGGIVSTSKDRGRSWKQVGRLEGNPGKLVETPDGKLYVALDSGIVQISTDGGRNWKRLFKP
jgi:hypothetical protein